MSEGRVVENNNLLHFEANDDEWSSFRETIAYMMTILQEIDTGKPLEFELQI